MNQCDTTVITPAEVVGYAPEGTTYPFNDSSRALGLPLGRGDASGSTDVVSLGDDGNGSGGSIILRFENKIINGEGTDFKVFENSFYYGENGYYVEAALVYLSLDNSTWYQYPAAADTGYETSDERFYSGYAGIFPVYSSREDPDSPLPESVDSGGDFFDLDAFPEGNEIRDNGFYYIKIVDAGDSISDPGNINSGNSGFDLDSVVGINYIE